MPVIPINNVGQVGIIKDVPGYELPANAWTSGQNVRMTNMGVEKANGYSGTWFTPQVAPYFLYPVLTPAAYYWLYCGLNEVFAVQATYQTNISLGGGYNANEFRRWTGTNLGGVIILNNSVEVPQFWQFPISHNQLLADLPNWPATDRCRVIRAYKNFLVACNIDRSGTAFPQKVKWSHSADVGAVPSSWDPADPTLDAGEFDMPQQGGAILDELVLRDINVIYRNEATWGQQFIGGNNIFRHWALFATSGILATDCVKEFYGKHFVVTTDDVIVHDGQVPQSVIHNRARDFFFADLDNSDYDRTYVVHNRADKEMWVCYPTSGNTLPNRAMVWSYAENHWSFRDLPGISHMAYGVLDSGALDAWDGSQGAWNEQSLTWATISSTWSTDTTTWSSDSRPWNYRTYDAQLLDLMMADPTAVRTYKGDDTNTNNGTAMTSRIERTGLIVVGRDKVDMYARKEIRAVYPKLSGTGTINIYVGQQNAVDEAVTWSAARPYTIGTDYKADFTGDRASNGRIMSVAFESTGDVNWALHSYELDIEVSGDR